MVCTARVVYNAHPLPNPHLIDIYLHINVHYNISATVFQLGVIATAAALNNALSLRSEPHHFPKPNGLCALKNCYVKLISWYSLYRLNFQRFYTQYYNKIFK